jgi:hypothetical protein
VESVEKQKQLSHPSHRPLGISPTTRDSHIPTAARDDDSGTLSKTQQPKKGSRPLRGLLIFTFQDHLVLETAPAFRIILGLENAEPPN